MTHDPLNDALSSLGEREWRAPDLDAITKERTMRTPTHRSGVRLAIGAGVALLAASAVGAATWYAGVFKGVITDEDGNEYQVELEEIQPGVFEGETIDGHRMKFVTDEAMGTVELTAPAGSGETNATVWNEKKQD
ncbi:MAG: hypothetical protein ACF8QF_13575 [Phycisphaerales bacterium]